jgi:glycosyltransferase involved in cell wall biosynthesis
MNVAILGIRGIPSRYGGFETSVEQTATRMVELGHNVTVYCRSALKTYNQYDYKGINLVYLPAIRLKSFETILHSLLAGFHAAFIHKNLDIVHMYNAASSFGGIFVKLSGTRLVMTLDGIEWNRDNWGWVAKKVWKIATWLSVKVSDKVVCDSKFVRDYYMSLYKSKIEYIPYGAKILNKSIVLDKSLGLKEKGYFLFVGRFVKEKSVDVLIEAYKKVDTDFSLVLIGDNENDIEYVKKLKSAAGKNVRFLGYRYGDEYESILVNTRAYVSASILEGTSPSLLAAMGAEVCCLVNGIVENRETGGDCIIYFDNSIDDLAEKLNTLVKDNDMLQNYANKGFNRVKNHYDWDVVTRNYLDCYSSN